MSKTFTDQDAADLVDCAVKLARTTATDDKGPQPMAICCRVAEQGVMGTPTAYRRMDGVKATSACMPHTRRPPYYCMTLIPKNTLIV